MCEDAVLALWCTYTLVLWCLVSGCGWSGMGLRWMGWMGWREGWVAAYYFTSFVGTWLAGWIGWVWWAGDGARKLAALLFVQECTGEWEGDMHLTGSMVSIPRHLTQQGERDAAR